MLVTLSYPLTRNSPLYPGTPAPVIEEIRSIERGDRYTMTTLRVNAHSGTHLDLPPHFCKGGIPCDLPPVIMAKPAYCVDLPKDRGAWIRPEDFAKVPLELSDAEAILVRTGWHRMRTRGEGAYADDYPRVHPDLPLFLRDRCPDLRLFGIDTLSIAVSTHREEGAAAHRGFLCGKPPVLLIEDMDLSDPRLVTTSFWLHVYPWMQDPRDGIPVTAVAELFP
jgi:kynurenine formamidase